MQENEIKQESLVGGSHRELLELMPYVDKSGRTLKVEGPMGVGKTDFFLQWAKKKTEMLKQDPKFKDLIFSDSLSAIDDEKTFLFISFIAHQMDMAETKGLLFPNKERTRADYLHVGNLPVKGQGIILFDEINLAPPSVQNNLYQMVTKGYVGQYRIPEGFTCYAACNTESDRANIYEMPMPLNNRMLHYSFKVPSTSRWIADYAVPNKVDHRIIGYLGDFKVKRLYDYKPDDDEMIKAFPTPRSWVYVSDLIRDIPDNAISLLEKLAGLAVGKVVGYEFAQFVNHSKDFNIAEIYKTGNVNIPTKPDMIYALSSAIVSYYKERIDDKKLVEKLHDLAIQFKGEGMALICAQAKAVDDQFLNKLKVVAPTKHKTLIETLSLLLV